MSHRPTNRRQFLARSVAAASASLAAPGVLGAEVKKQQLHVACVGVNGMGWADLSQVAAHAAVKLVGFCDVDANRFDKVDAEFPGVPHFADYREMFGRLGNKVDAVTVATPDHMHAPVAMAAMQLGKHVYCQKPLTHTVWESRQMRLLADQMDLTTQMGNQIHSHEFYRRGVRLIQGGAIGKIKEVHSWVGVQGRQYCNRTDRPPESSLPGNVNWDLWIGAAPMRPYAADVYHPFKWRDWQDFGSGALGDFGCHILDPVFGALNLTAPLRVMSENVGTTDEVWPGPETVTFVFPKTERTAGEQINIFWRDGGLKPPRELAQLPEGVELPGAGSLFIGQQGTMVLPHVGAPALYPQKDFAGYSIPVVTGLNHWHVWVDAILDGKKTSDGFHYSGPLAETVQLGNVSARFPREELVWDVSALEITNNTAANALLAKTYRSGFEVKAV